MTEVLALDVVLEVNVYSDVIQVFCVTISLFFNLQSSIFHRKAEFRHTVDAVIVF